MSYDGPLNALPGSDETSISLYGYTPNRGFNIFAAIAWGLVLLAHAWWLLKKKTRAIQALIVFGADLFVAQYTILHTAPIFFIMALVNAIGWAMRGTDDDRPYEKFRPRTMVLAFHALNTIILILVVIGSVMYAVAIARVANLRHVGYDGDATRKVLITGHALKIVSIVTILAILSHLLIHFKADSVGIDRHNDRNAINNNNAANYPVSATPSHTTAVNYTTNTARTGRALTKMFLLLSWLTSGMLLLRTCYRLAETVQDVYSSSWSSELLFGLFEFAVTFLSVTIWAARPFATQLAPGGIVNNAREYDLNAHANKTRV